MLVSFAMRLAFSLASHVETQAKPQIEANSVHAIAVGIAILRCRLYEMVPPLRDRLFINRTLVYGPFTAMLVLVYLGGVVSVQHTFRVLTGQASQVAIAASTLAIAALFNPLRRRNQVFVDRRFYRRKYDARKTLETFSAKLRDKTDLNRLEDELVGVVAETMQPTHAGLWLRPDSSAKGDRGEES